MKFNFDIGIEKKEIEVGDIVILSDKSVFLMCLDEDGEDFRAVNLNDNCVTPYYCNVDQFIKEISGNNREVVRIIKSNSIVLDIKE